MKEIKQQEIPLVQKSNFPGRVQLEEKDSFSPSQEKDTLDDLEETCWNGLLEADLPGLVEKDETGSNLYMWRIWHGERDIRIDLGENPCIIQTVLSIDPYKFNSGLVKNKSVIQPSSSHKVQQSFPLIDLLIFKFILYETLFIPLNYATHNICSIGIGTTGSICQAL